MKHLKYILPLFFALLAGTAQAQVQGSFWKLVSGTLQPVINSYNVYAPANLRFDGEIQPDGSTCSTGDILQRAGANDWDCVATSTLPFLPASGGTNGYIARWTSSSALSTGILLDNGTVAGINATSSSYTLNVQGSAGVAPLNVASSTGTSLMVVTGAGNVGLGTTTPIEKLALFNGNIQLTSTDQTATRIKLRNTGTNGRDYHLLSGVVNVGQDGFSIFDNTAGATRFVITSGGNVGIGTTSAVSSLQVAGGTIHFLFSDTTANNSNKIGRMGSPHYEIAEEPVGALVTSIGNGSNLLLWGGGSSGVNAATTQQWYTAANSTTTTGTLRMTLSSDGNLGVGAAPSSVVRLDAVQNQNGDSITRMLNNDTGTSARGMFRLQNSASTADVMLTGANYSAVSGWGNRMVLNTASAISGGILIRPGAGGFQVSANGNTNDPNFVVAATSGNVGIGEASPGSALSVSGGATIGASYSTTAAPTNGLLVQGNVGIGTTSPGTKLQIYDSANTYPLSIRSNSGTNLLGLGVVTGITNGTPAIQGFTNSFGATDLVFQPSGGNVGIGTTSPNSRLHVYGTTGNLARFQSNFNGSIPNLYVDNVENNKGYSLRVAGSASSFGSGSFVLYDETAAQNRFLVATSGAVSIGGLHSSGKLQVHQAANTSSDGIALMATDGNGAVLYREVGAQGALILRNNSTDTLYLKSGNIGIGTSTPQSLVHLFGTGFTPLTLERRGADAFGQGLVFKKSRAGTGVVSGDQIVRLMAFGELDTGAYAAATNAQDFMSAEATETFTATAQGRQTSFYVVTNGTAARTTALQLLNTGVLYAPNNVGVGTTTPAAKLVVVGGAGATAFTVASSTGTSLVSVNPAGDTSFGSQYYSNSTAAATSTISTTTKTINWNDGNFQSFVLATSTTLSFSNVKAAGRYLLVLQQDSTGSRTVTWPSGVKWPSATAPTLTTTANQVDIVSLACYSTGVCFANSSLNFAP